MQKETVRRMHEAEAKLKALTAKADAEASVLRRQTVETAIRECQEELAVMYPELNDLAAFRSKIAPRASALLKAGIHTNMRDALREAAHAAYGDEIEADRAALAARENPLRTPVQKSDGQKTPRRQVVTPSNQLADVWVAVRDEHPDWTPARVKAEAKRRAGKVVSSKPFIRT